MNPFIISIIISYSILVAAVIGLIRWKHIVPSYRPFVVICIVAIVNEIVATFSAVYFQSNAINLNIYMLVESMLYMCLFRKWNAITQASFVTRCTFLGLLWVTDNLLVNDLFTINSLFMVIYFFSLIFLAVGEINKIILSRNESILRDSRSLICLGITIFYTYAVIIETFYLLKLNFSNEFYNKIHLVLEIVNFLVNILFAIAVVMIPRKQRFIVPL